MADILPRDLPPAPTVPGNAAIIVDNGVDVERATPAAIVNTGRPNASQAEATAGVDATKGMTPATTKAAILALSPLVSGNVARTVAEVQAYDTNKTALLYDQATWTWTLGDYSDTPADQLNVNVIEADSAALSVGAWVRQGANGVVFEAPLGGLARALDKKIAELGVSVTDYGAVPNIDTPQVAVRNRNAINAALSLFPTARIPGNSSDFYAIASGAIIPSGKALMGDGAILRMKGEGITLNDESTLAGVGVVGLLAPSAEDTPGSGVPGAASATPASTLIAQYGTTQYALVYAMGKKNVTINLTYLANGPINGIQASNCTAPIIHVERAENFGSDAVRATEEGAAIYMPATSGAVVTFDTIARTFALGSILTTVSSRNTFRGRVIRNTRRAGIWNGGTSGPGNRITGIFFQNMGELTPEIGPVGIGPGKAPFNHYQTTAAVYWDGAQRKSDCVVEDCDVENWGETLVEGNITVRRMFANVTSSGGVNWDDRFISPNPAGFAGNMILVDCELNNYRGRGYNAGFGPGQGVLDITLDSLRTYNPRPTGPLPKPDGTFDSPQAAEFVHIQVDGPGNVADNIIVRNCVGYDSTGNVSKGYSIAATSGASFSRRCQVTNNQSSQTNNEVDFNIQQIGNSWNPFDIHASPNHSGTDSEEAGGGFTRRYNAYGLYYSRKLGSWVAEDVGAARMMTTLGNGAVNTYIVPASIPSGPISNGALAAYLVHTTNMAGDGGRLGPTGDRPTTGIYPGLRYYDTTLDKPIWRNAANTAWRDAGGTPV